MVIWRQYLQKGFHKNNKDYAWVLSAVTWKWIHQWTVWRSFSLKLKLQNIPNVSLKLVLHKYMFILATPSPLILCGMPLYCRYRIRGSFFHFVFFFLSYSHWPHCLLRFQSKFSLYASGWLSWSSALLFQINTSLAFLSNPNVLFVPLLLLTACQCFVMMNA